MIHKVKSGESLYKIANGFSMQLSIKHKCLPSIYTNILFIGQPIY
ncbi:LysM peptidoglycan-binding domain-containing protein [Rummeliibacillus pycnus]